MQKEKKKIIKMVYPLTKLWHSHIDNTIIPLSFSFLSLCAKGNKHSLLYFKKYWKEGDSWIEFFLKKRFIGHN